MPFMLIGMLVSLVLLPVKLVMAAVKMVRSVLPI